jgi:hypothetical protein
MSSPVIPDEFDSERPSVARLYDYLLGGTHNFAADRELARKLLEAEPNARYIVAENRAFLGRAVRFLLSAGIRQFIDLGAGIPTHQNVHEIAQKHDQEAKVVYVDNDPVAVAHSRQILWDRSRARVIESDLTDPDSILDHPDVTSLIDLNEPVGLLMISVLHFVPNSGEPVSAVGRFARTLAPDSHLVIAHATHEAAPEAAAQVHDLSMAATASIHPRAREEIMPFFSGFDLVEPGLVYISSWRPDEPPTDPDVAWILAGVGRKR